VGVPNFYNTTNHSHDRVATAFDSAIALIPLTFGMALGAIIGGWLSDRIGYRLTTCLGLTMAVFGFIIMAKWQPSWQMPADLLLLFPGAGLTGLGFGLVIAPVGTAVIDWADREDMGVSAALVLILRLVGMTVGLALLLQWGLGRFRDLTANAPLDNNYNHVIQYSLAQVITEMFIASTLIAALALIPAIFLRRRPAGSLSEEEKQRRHELGRLL
jgi:MFS family permease